jgi:hypothetical protein
MDLARILEQAQRDTMNWRVTPSLIKESTGTIQMIEIILIRLTPPEIHIRYLEIAPEMAGAISVGL